ncbi:hypothetical protein B0H14DRAFT_2699944 [Mycena olivaceomarginata]|nr:hypothetical protein B0H14DRAFT_2699944 [Mycena olivaceomarginata]
MHASVSKQEARINALELHRQHEDADAISKDATQILIGKLATLRETTVRQIHDDMDLSPSEYNPAEHSPRINI